MLIEKANDASITTYSGGVTTEMYTFSQPDTEQLSATIDYRYIGSSPNNYITFNNELWRIIGVFDGKIKIVRDQSIGSMPFDYKTTGIGSSTSDDGSNDWWDAQLMYMLNPNDIYKNVYKKDGYTYNGTYVYDANDKIIYRSGCLPAKTLGSSYTCTSNTWTLSETALEQVTDVIYYLAGPSGSSGLSAIKYYTQERGNAIYNDVRSVNWNGKVGLMYPSDYAYTFGHNVDETCYSDTYNCETGTPSSSWLFNSEYQRTITPSSSYSYLVSRIQTDGGHVLLEARLSPTIRPVVYLKDSVMLSGTGTSADPYEVVSNFY